MGILFLYHLLTASKKKQTQVSVFAFDRDAADDLLSSQHLRLDASEHFQA